MRLMIKGGKGRRCAARTFRSTQEMDKRAGELGGKRIQADLGWAAWVFPDLKKAYEFAADLKAGGVKRLKMVKHQSKPGVAVQTSAIPETS